MYGLITTTAGGGLLARASADEGLAIIEVRVGKGMVENAAATKALTAPLDLMAQVTSIQPEMADGQLSMLVEYRNDMGGGLGEGFTLSEFDVMAKVGDDAPILLYYAALGDPAQPVPPIVEGLDVHRFPVVIGATGEVEVSLEHLAGIWVTHEELKETLAGIGLSGYIKAAEKGQPGGVTALEPDGKVPGEQLPKMDYDPAGSVEAVQKNLTAHTENENNPHAVTAEQVGTLASSGGVMSGAISMSGHKIVNLAAPADSTDAANKQYVGEHAGARVILGSYVGTGKTGKSNPNQITLVEPFKILCIYSVQSNNYYKSIDGYGNDEASNTIHSSIIPAEHTKDTSFGFGYRYSSKDSYDKGSTDERTFSWYLGLITPDATNEQLNAFGAVYYYHVIV